MSIQQFASMSLYKPSAVFSSCILLLVKIFWNQSGINLLLMSKRPPLKRPLLKFLQRGILSVALVATIKPIGLHIAASYSACFHLEKLH